MVQNPKHHHLYGDLMSKGSEKVMLKKIIKKLKIKCVEIKSYTDTFSNDNWGAKLKSESSLTLMHMMQKKIK